MGDIDEIKQAFQKYDKDKNGFITVDEAHAVLREELSLSKAASERLVKIYDRNTDGRLSYEEFIWFYWKIQQKKKHLEDMFQRFDENGSKTISVEEASVVLTGLGFTKDNINHLINLHDVNKDGVLQYEEFVTFWQNVTN